MKSINKNLLFLFSCFLLLTSCCEEKKASEVPKEKLITRKTAKAYYDNYTIKYKKISEITGKEDSRVFWYSYEQLEGLINYFKEESKKKNIESDGIMFYLGAYPNSQENSRYVNRSISNDKSGYTNLILVPSQTINGYHVDVPLEYNANDAELSPPPYHKFGDPSGTNFSLIDGGN